MPGGTEWLVLLGVGLGAYLEEFTAQNSGLVSIHRGNMLDEALEALFELLTKDRASFEGKYYHFSGIELSRQHGLWPHLPAGLAPALG